MELGAGQELNIEYPQEYEESLKSSVFLLL